MDVPIFGNSATSRWPYNSNRDLRLARAPYSVDGEGGRVVVINGSAVQDEGGFLASFEQLKKPDLFAVFSVTA